MSIYMGVSWMCERCRTLVNAKPWPCPVCGKETCDSCFDRYMVCRSCSEGRTDAEVKRLSRMDWDEE